MRTWWHKTMAGVPGPFLTALGVSAGFMAFTAWDQSYWWRTKEDYSFGWLAPVFVLYLVSERWPKICAGLAACRREPRAQGWRRWLLRMAAGGALAVGLLFFLFGALYRAGSGVSQPGTFVIALGTALVTLALVFLNAPARDEIPAVPPPSAPDFKAEPRLRLLALFVFPALVWIVSAPLVSAVESTLSLFLLHKVTGVVFYIFDRLGLPIEQQGNVLVLPTGRVGVLEACSGIRSLTGCLFAGSFLAAVFLEKGWKKIALVACSMLLAFLTNLLRSLFLTGWAYAYGPQAMEGRVHDTAGYAVLGLTVVGLLCLLPLFNLQLPATGDALKSGPHGTRKGGD